MSTGSASVAHADTAPDHKSPVVAGLLSATPTVLGLGLGVGGLIVANIDDSCTGQSPSCTDYFGLGVTLAGTGAVILAVGPSLGHMYNGRTWTTGLKVRIAGASISALGLGIALLPIECDGFVCPHEGIGALIVGAGALTLATGAVIDATTAASKTRERNAGLSVARLRTSNGDSTPAVMFHTTF